MLELIDRVKVAIRDKGILLNRSKIKMMIIHRSKNNSIDLTQVADFDTARKCKLNIV